MNTPEPADQRTIVRFAEEDVLRPLLRGLGIDAFIEIRHREEGTILSLEHAADSGHLIGKDGHTLAAIQYLLNLVIAKRFGPTRALLLDCAGYRSRYKSGLDQIATDAAKSVQQTGTPVTLEPMPAADRRVVHTALRDYDNIQTISVDEDPETGMKRVQISPIGYVPPSPDQVSQEPETNQPAPPAQE